VSTLFLDVTNYVHSPTTTGIERQFLAFSRNRLHGQEVVPTFVGKDGQVLALGEGFWRLVEDAAMQHLPADLVYLQERHHGGLAEQTYWRARSQEVLAAGNPLSEAELLSGKLLALAFVFDQDRLDLFERLQRMRPEWLLPLCVDLLLWTNPEHIFRAYPVGVEHAGTARFLRLLQQSPRILFASRHVEQVFRSRIAPNWNGTSYFATPGTDALTLYPRQLATSELGLLRTVVVLGTIEVRRPWRLIVAAVDQLRKEFGPIDLTFAGALNDTLAEDDKSAFVDLMSRNGNRWIKSPSDNQIAHLLSEATCLVYLSEDEGFGVPPLEGLRARTPVVASKDIPSVQPIRHAALAKVNHAVDEVVRALRQHLTTPQLTYDWQSLEIHLTSWADYVSSCMSVASLKESASLDWSGAAIAWTPEGVLRRLVGQGSLPDQLNALARTTIGRSLTRDEESSWTQRVTAGLTPESVVCAFLTCDEAANYRAMQGCAEVDVASSNLTRFWRALLPSWYQGESDEEWVRGCYSDILHRMPSDMDLEEYVHVAQRSRKDVAEALVSSPELIGNLESLGELALYLELRRTQEETSEGM
jgi:glycosyltransferase involved in cell wall biosynthesis